MVQNTGSIIDLHAADPELPSGMCRFLALGKTGLDRAAAAIKNTKPISSFGIKLLPPGALEAEKTRTLTLPDHYLKGEIIPLKIKIAIDAWAHEIVERSQEYAPRVLKSVLDHDGLIKLAVLQLATFCLRDYLEEQGIRLDYDILKSFIKLMLEGILKKVEEEFKNRKKLN